MPNIVIANNADSVDVNFNDMSTPAKMVKGRWRRTMIHSIVDRSTHIEVFLAHGRRWEVVHNGSTNQGLVVDSVGGVTTDTHESLYTNLQGLI